MVILCFVLLALILVGGIFSLYCINLFSNWYMIAMMCTIFAGFALLILVIALPISRLDVNSNIRKFNQAKRTIEMARHSQERYIENASLTAKMIELNGWLVEAQYWDEGFWDIYYPDAIRTLKPLNRSWYAGKI